MQKKLAIIVILFLIIFGCGLVVMNILKRVPDNDPNTVGNTSGNLNNEGLFCEDDGIIYFANVYDNNYLYSMNSDGSDVKCVYQAPVSYINSAGKYLYFYESDNAKGSAFGSFIRSNGIYRYKKGSKKDTKCLDRTPSKVVALCGSNLYYEHYNTSEGIALYSVSLNGGDRHMVVESDINPACIYQGNIFYPDVDNGFLMSCFRTDSETSHPVIADMKTYNLQYDNGHLYYLNVSDDYKLYRYDIGSDSVIRLTDCRVDIYNVLDDVIFYQKNGTKNAALVRMDSNGDNATVVAEGNYKNISMTSNYTFFRPYDEDNMYYYTSTKGAPSIAKFTP